MNEQALFDKSLAHIRKQGGPGYDKEENVCVYQSSDGLGCAFAPAIETYRPEMEGRAASELLSEGWDEDIFEEFREVECEFADDLQSAHDDADQRRSEAFMEAFEANMRELAGKYNLTYSE